jgi:hypothetical protein
MNIENIGILLKLIVGLFKRASIGPSRFPTAKIFAEIELVQILSGFLIVFVRKGM